MLLTRSKGCQTDHIHLRDSSSCFFGRILTTEGSEDFAEAAERNYLCVPLRNPPRPLRLYLLA